MTEHASSRPQDVDGCDVGRRIAQARQEAGGMSQKTLAELLCVCRRSVQSYEAGRTIPYRHLHRLGEIFERPASWFLYGGEPASPSPDEPHSDLVERVELQTRALGVLAAEVRALRSALDELRPHLEWCSGRSSVTR